MAKTLLLADDSVTIQKVVNISFASEDVTLVTVDNGDDALERAKETRPDLILADVVMPGKNGYEVCEAVKADPDLAHIPVLLLTGTFEAFDEERAARAGAAGHVAKPFEAQTLVSQVNRLLAEAPPPAAAAAREPAPVAPPEAVTTPATDGSEKGDSFDFFDDDLADLAAPDTAAAESDSVSFGDSDSAFAFGDEDLAPASPEPVREEAELPPSAPQDLGASFDERPAPDRTVAIIPEDAVQAEVLPADPVPAPPAEVPPTALSADLGDSGFADAGDEIFAIPEREPEVAGFADAVDEIFAIPEREPEVAGVEDAGDEIFAIPEREPEVAGVEDAGDEMFAIPEREPEVSGVADASDEMFAIPEREPEVSVVADAGDEMFAIPEREPEVSGVADASDEMLSAPESEPEDSFALVDPSSTSDEAFDFTFDSEPVAAEPAMAEGPMSVEAEDLAQATVLDPNGAAGYDVSSSDLGDPFAAEPLGEAGEPADATRLMDFPAAMDEPVAAAELTGVGDFGEELAPAVFEPEEPPAEPARNFEPPATAEPAFEPPAEAVRPFTEEPAVRADSVLSEIAPTLRAEIHDTLEKVAWESFGNVTEKIIADAVDRVEKIAWEVIPQLAETLIKEEIRRLKGESDD